LQGETSRVGLPTVFVRLTGCPLRCGYCDTSYAFQGGRWMSVDEVLDAVSAYAPRHVTVTGGEPLAQRDCGFLLRALCDADYDVSLETSGALDIADVDARVARVVDIKTPGSGEVERNRWENLDLLTPRDELKLVLTDAADYLWARQLLQDKVLNQRCSVLFSPCHPSLPPGELADWILRDRLPVRMQLQMHKLLWGEVPGR
jgi:7-carboxy-7-deazaguanine synthase